MCAFAAQCRNPQARDHTHLVLKLPISDLIASLNNINQNRMQHILAAILHLHSIKKRDKTLTRANNSSSIPRSPIRRLAGWTMLQRRRFNSSRQADLQPFCSSRGLDVPLGFEALEIAESG